MASLKVHVLAAARFLEDHEETLYRGLAGEALFMDDFRNAFFAGAIFPDYRLFAPLRRHVTHDDPGLFSCPACGGAVAIEDAECAGCKNEWWPGKAKFQSCFKRDSADAEDFWKAHVAAARSDDRLAEEMRPGRKAPLNFALGDKHPYPARLRLDAKFFEKMKALDFAKAGLPALDSLTRSHLGFFAGVVHHLAVDRARDFFRLEERLAWEAAADAIAGDDLARIAARLALWAEAPPEGRAPIGQAAYAIVGRWPAEARVYLRPDADGRPAEQWVGRYPVKDDAALVGPRLQAFVRAAAKYLAEPATAAALEPLVEATRECSDKDWFFDRARWLAPLLAPAPAEPPSPEEIEAVVVEPAARATLALLRDGYPEPDADERGVFHATRRPDRAALPALFEVLERPADLAEHFDERGTVRWADATRGQGRDFDLARVKSGDTKTDEKDWKDLRTMDHAEFVLLCAALAGRLGQEGARDASEKPVYSAAEALKEASRNWAVQEAKPAPPPPPAAPASPPEPGSAPAPAAPLDLPVPARDDLVVLRLPSGEIQDCGIAVSDGLMIHNQAADPFPPRVRGSHVKRVPPLIFLENVGPDRKVAKYGSIQIGTFQP